MNRLLIPVDFSSCSRKAINLADDLPLSKNSEIILLHVLETFPIDYVIGANETKISLARLEESIRAHLEKVAGTLKSAKRQVQVLVRWGQPWREVCKAAVDLQASLIVIGSHGRTGVKRIYFGSTAERVVRHAFCPVLVVRNTAIPGISKGQQENKQSNQAIQ